MVLFHWVIKDMTHVIHYEGCLNNSKVTTPGAMLGLIESLVCCTIPVLDQWSVVGGRWPVDGVKVEMAAEVKVGSVHSIGMGRRSDFNSGRVFKTLASPDPTTACLR